MKAADIDKDALPALRARERLKGKSMPEIVTIWLKSDDPFPLSDAEDALRQRWMAARAHFMSLKNYAEVVQHIMDEFSISIAQARIDIRHMQAVFGDIEKVGKDAHRARAIEMSLKAFKVAEKKEDADGMAKATKVYYLSAGLDKEDVDRVDLERMMRERTYAEVLDPMIRNLLLNFLNHGGGSVDVSEIFERINHHVGTETIDYEAVQDTPQ
jgi:hypothetical protein